MVDCDEGTVGVPLVLFLTIILSIFIFKFKLGI